MTKLLYVKSFVLEALLENCWLFFGSNFFLNFALDSTVLITVRRYITESVSVTCLGVIHCQIDSNELQVAKRMLVNLRKEAHHAAPYICVWLHVNSYFLEDPSNLPKCTEMILFHVYKRRHDIYNQSLAL